MYPKWLTYTLRYFDAWSCCTEFSSSRYYQIFIHFALCTHIVLGVGTAIKFTQYLNQHTNDILGTVNDTIKLNGFQLLLWTSIYESYSKRKHQRRFWKIFKEIDRNYCCHQRFRLYSHHIETGIYILLYFLMKISSSIESMYKNVYYDTFWYFYEFVCMIYQHRSFYFMFYLNLVEHELKIIKRETEILSFKSIEFSNAIKTNKHFKGFVLKRLEWVRNYYTLIHDMRGHLNDIFGRFNVLYIPFSFLLITTETNWLYWQLYNHYAFYGLLFSMIKKIVKQISNEEKKRTFV